MNHEFGIPFYSTIVSLRLLSGPPGEKKLGITLGSEVELQAVTSSNKMQISCTHQIGRDLLAKLRIPRACANKSCRCMYIVVKISRIYKGL